MEVPILRLPVELLQQIARYVDDPRSLCALVSSCRQTYFYVGRDFVHVRCAKAGATLSSKKRAAGWWYSTLDGAAKACFDKDIFAGILDIYIAHYPQCLNLFSEISPGNERNGSPLHTAIKYRNIEAFQLLLDRGAKIVRWDDNKSRWTTSCPLSQALKRPSSGIVQSLIAAGHEATTKHVEQAVGSNNVDLAEMVIERALQSQHVFGGRRVRRGLHVTARFLIHFWSDFPLWKAIKHSKDKDTRMLELLIEKGASLCEVDDRQVEDYYENGWDPEDRPDLSYSAPVGFALHANRPQTAIFLMRQQVQKCLVATGDAHNIIQLLCTSYSEGRRRKTAKFPTGEATYTKFMKGFHPELTPHFFHDKFAEQPDIESWREGCDFLLATSLKSCSPSHGVIKHLLRNGCTVSTDMLLMELHDVWVSASHCLTSKDRRPNLLVCSKCDQSEGVESRFAHKKCTLRSSMSRLDAFLSRMSLDSINATGALIQETQIGICDYNITKLTTTPLDFALTYGLWIVAYRLIHYGADLSLLNRKAKGSIRELYKSTFANGGDIHPLVLKAWDGRFVPDKVAFSHGLGPKRDEQRQALTLVMITIGLGSKRPQNKRCVNE